jgi:hypothetical protein
MARLPLLPLGFALLVLLSAPVYASGIQCSNPGTGNQSPNSTFVDANSCVDYSSSVQGANNWYYGYYTSETTTGTVNPYASPNPPILDPKTFTDMAQTPLLGANGQILPNQYTGVWSQNFFQYWTSLDAYGGHSNGTYTDLHPIDTAPGYPSIWVPGPNSYCNFTGVGYDNCNPNGGWDPMNPTGPDDGNYWATRRYVVPNYTGDVTIDLSTQRVSNITNAQGYTDYIMQYNSTNGTVADLGSVYVPGNAPTSQIFSTVATAYVTPGTFIDFVIVPQYEQFKYANGSSLPPGYADFASGQVQLDTISSGGGQIAFPVPEPGTAFLMSAGLLLFAFALRRRFA